MIKNIPFLILLMFSAIALSKGVVAQNFTFEEAWRQVLLKSDALAAEQKNIEHSQYRQDAASDLLLPSITLGANYTRLDRDLKIKPSALIESMPSDALTQALGMPTSTLDSLFTSTLTQRDIFSSSIRAIWPVYTGGRIGAAQDIASAKHDEAVYMLAMKKQEKFEELAKYYFAVVLSKQVLKTRQDVERGLQKHFDDAKKLEQQGQINKLERIQAQVSLDKSRVEFKKSLRDLEIAQVALARLLKTNEKVETKTHLFINDDLPGMAKYLDKTLANYPILNVLNAKKAQAKGLITVEKGKYYPEVYLYGHYNLYEDNTFASEVAPDWEIGIGFSIPIIDSSGRSGKTKAAHSLMMQVQYLKAQAIQDLSVLVEKTYREANQSLEEYQGLASSIALANENLNLRKKAFNQGLSTSLDVVDAQLYVASIKIQRLVAAYHYVLSLSQLLAVSGEMNSFQHYQAYQGTEVK